MKDYEPLNVEIISFEVKDIVRASLTTAEQETGFDAKATWWE